MIIGKISYGLDAINTFLNSELEKIQKGENSILEIVIKNDIDKITKLSFLDDSENIEFNIKKNYDRYIETNNIADLSLYNKRI